MYFDQRTGAPHAVCWSKSFFDAKTTFSVNFYHKMFRKPQKVTIKHVKKGVYQRLGVTFFVYFVPLVTKNVVLASEILFQPGNGRWSLVEIHNKYHFSSRIKHLR